MRPVMLVLSLVLAIISLAGVVWIFASGMLSLWPPSATVDGLFMTLILLSLFGCFALDAYWEMRDRGMLNFMHKQKEAAAATKAPVAKAS